MEIKEVITDPKHWIGWFLTVGVIIGIFHLLQVHGLHMPWWHVLVLLGVVVGVDLFKYATNLQ